MSRHAHAPAALLGLLAAAGCVGPPAAGRSPLTAAPPAASGEASQPDPADDAARLLALHNARRAEAGRGPLVLDERLSAAALVQARDCARRDRLTHRGGDGSSPGERLTRAGVAWARCAENAAQQPRPPVGWPGADPRTPDWAMEGWLRSRGHRANLLGPFTRMGSASADAADGTRYWVVTFATPSGDAREKE